MKTAFLDKLIERLDKLDPKSIQAQFLHLAQERGLLETIFQTIQEGVMVIDGAGNLTYANRAAEAFMGFSVATVRNRPVSSFLPDIDWDRVLDLDGGEWSKLITREIEITYPQHRFLSFYVVPLSLDEQGEKGAVVMLRDVTHERRRTESVLESERFNAIQLLAAGVAHEIGNPLNALNIHLQLLDRVINDIEDTRKDDLRELVRVARDEVTRLDLIITQFLRAIRPTQPQLASTDIEQLLTDTLTLLRQEVQDRHIDIEIRKPESIPQVRVDAGQIKQAFFNVIRNAFQAMTDGGRLEIAFSTSNEFLIISFRDNGIGIAADNLARIFEPYHTTKPHGSGLGLMIVQRIVQEHGGQIEVSSKPDCGTVVSLLLPLAERRLRLLKAPSASRTVELFAEDEERENTPI